MNPAPDVFSQRAAVSWISGSVRFRLDGMKTPNPANGSTVGSRLAASGMKKKQRKAAYRGALLCLKKAGMPTTQFVVAGKIRKGKMIAAAYLREVIASAPGKWSCTLTRISQGRLDDHDGLPGALKSIVDGIADALNVNDGDRTRFAKPVYRQRKEGVGIHAVEIEIRRDV